MHEQERAEMIERRKHGLEARHRTRAIGCRYVDLKGMCGNEAMDQTADILLCRRHLALAAEMLLPRLRGGSGWAGWSGRPGDL